MAAGGAVTGSRPRQRDDRHSDREPPAQLPDPAPGGAGATHQSADWIGRNGSFWHCPVGGADIQFPALHVSWDTNAYGSITWTLLSLHTTHLITDLVDTLVLAALMFTRHGRNKRRLGDVEDNALYWYFVVVTWLPIYGVLYWGPRL
jgi:hypothetical protein